MVVEEDIGTSQGKGVDEAAYGDFAHLASMMKVIR